MSYTSGFAEITHLSFSVCPVIIFSYKYLVEWVFAVVTVFQITTVLKAYTIKDILVK